VGIRNRPGVTPTSRLKCRQKTLWSAKPARRDLAQGEVRAGLQELLSPLDAAGDEVLVRRQPGGRRELPREVVDAEMGDGSQLPQSQAGLQVFLYMLGDGAELRSGERAVPPERWWVGRQDVP
jgi:hypothetical protein